MKRLFTLFTLLALASMGMKAQDVVVISDDDLQGNQTYNWTADKVYQLDGFVYLEAGGVLNIAPGTRIEGLPENDNDEIGTLIIARGAQIFAEGTAAEPIVFSAEGLDDLTADPGLDRGSWGGLIILGNGVLGDENSSGVANVEGIEAEARNEYGGGANPNNAESSGTLRYVSIRFGGFPLTPDNEINGLTLGAVGSGTTIEHVEIFANDDDGIEFFGGAVDVKYGVVVFCADDSYDTDQAWSGRGQFWFSLQDSNDAGNSNPNGGEHDGTEDPNDATGGPVQTVYNATYIGRGEAASIAGDNNALTIKKNAAISYNNSIFTKFDDFAISFQDGSADRYVANEFDLNNNIWFAFGGGSALTDVIHLDDNTATLPAVIAAVAADGNEVVDPELAQVSYTPSTNNGADGNGVDPRPGPDSPARSGAADVPPGDFYSAVDFRGAFNPDNALWATWTLSYQRGLLVETLVNTVDFASGNGVSFAVSPNPTSDILRLNVELPAATQANATLFDQVGRQIAQFDLGQLQAGVNQPSVDLGALANGNYYILLNTKFGAVSQRVTVTK